jgi:hypothetical protein
MGKEIEAKFINISIPDIEVKISEEDINTDKDPQLVKALEEAVK